jgi:glycosyltransferase involved in cell wall biosynthesis
MKILLIHNHYRSETPSGEDRVFEQEGSALADAGHTVRRFERFSDDIARRPMAGRAIVPAQVVWSDAARRSLKRFLRDERPDVVHLHNPFPLLSPSVLYACRAERVPLVTTVHNYRLLCSNGALFRDGAPCRDCVGRLPLSAVRHGCYRDSPVATMPMAASQVVHRRAWRTLVSAYVFLSEVQRDIIAADGFPRARLFVKPNFVPDPGPAATTRDSLVVYAGRLTSEKGLEVLQSAWDRYLVDAGTGAGLRLAIAGAGPLEHDVVAWAKSRASVDWLGPLSRGDCAALLSRARAVIVPSIWEETFGLVAVEAMAAGVPPVASALGSLPALINDRIDGVLFPPGDASTLARVLQEVDADPGHFRVLGEAARRTFERRFGRDANVEQLIAVYDFAIQHPVTALSQDVESSL